MATKLFENLDTLITHVEISESQKAFKFIDGCKFIAMSQTKVPA